MAYTTTRDAIINRSAGWQTTLAAELATSPPTLTAGQKDALITLAMISTPTQAGNAVVLTAEKTVTAEENGSTFYINHATGFAITLPTGVLGMNYKFINKTANTSGDHTVTSATADTIVGYPIASSGGDETAQGNAAGDVINFKANASLPGDMVELFHDGAVWYCRITCKATSSITITG